MIGAVPGLSYPVQRTPIPVGSRLYVFSDGVFEITTKTGGRWGIAEFLPLLTAARVDGRGESERLFRTVQNERRGPLEDDFSMVVLTFP
jgi:sigma-B regulation protein RsbU (phosphoserine phosphatase)